MRRRVITSHDRVAKRQSCQLLSNTEAAENQIQNVIRGGLAGDGVQRAQCSVEIEHDHLMRDSAFHGLAGIFKAGDGFFHQAPMAHVGEKAAFLLCAAVA